jgi:hypothetical protein
MAPAGPHNARLKAQAADALGQLVLAAAVAQQQEERRTGACQVRRQAFIRERIHRAGSIRLNARSDPLEDVVHLAIIDRTAGFDHFAHSLADGTLTEIVRRQRGEHARRLLTALARRRRRQQQARRRSVRERLDDFTAPAHRGGAAGDEERRVGADLAGDLDEVRLALADVPELVEAA